jgi:hypothetical protein
MKDTLYQLFSINVLNVFQPGSALPVGKIKESKNRSKIVLVNVSEIKNY